MDPTQTMDTTSHARRMLRTNHARTMAYKEDPGLSEATLAYHLRMREALLYEYTDEAEDLKDTVYAQAEKNRKLRRENAEHFEMLVEQIAEQNRAEDQAQKVHVEQVAMALKDKFIYVQDSENEVEVLQWQISECKEQIQKLTEELDKWRYFKDVTYPEGSAKMATMHDELKRMKEVEREEASMLQSKLEVTKEEIRRRGDARQEKEKDALTENLLSLLDAKTLGEYRDNIWLRRELQSQQEAFDRLLEENSAIERQNLEVLHSLLASQEEEGLVVSGQLSGTGRRGSSRMGQLVRLPGRGSGGMTPEDGSVTSRAEHLLRGSPQAMGGAGERRQEVVQQMDQISLTPLGLQELRRLKVTGKSPIRVRSRPSTNEGVSLPRIPSAEQSTCGSHSRKQSWPVSVRMLKSMTTTP